MNQPTCSNSQIEEDSPGSPSRSGSSSSSSTEVYSSQLGFDSSIVLSQDEENLLEVPGNLSVAQGNQSIISNSPGAWIGTGFNVHVDGNTKITVNHVHAPVENSTDKNAPTSPPPPPPQKPHTGTGLIKRHFKVLIVLITTITLACAVALITLRFIGTSGGDGLIGPTTEDTETTTRGLPIRYTFNRTAWGAREPTTTPIPLKSAPSLVVIKHTKTKGCHDVSSCFTAMYDLQNTDVGIFGLSDIRYNFVVGGDGNIYEGRGWSVQNEQKNNSIDIAYVGDFNRDVPSEFMVGAGPWIVVKGMLNGFLDWSNIKVVCHNQTEDTDSPGENLYKEVVKWTYYSGDIIG